MNGTGQDDAVMLDEHEGVVIEDGEEEVIDSDLDIADVAHEEEGATAHAQLNQWLQEYYAIEAEVAPHIERQRELVQQMGAFLSTLPGRKAQLADGGHIKVMKSGDVRVYPPSEAL